MSTRGERTQFKLDEAKFFLDLLSSNYQKERKFDYFLSAFVSAARSVAWVMRAEYSDVPGWSEWFTALRPSDAEKTLLKGINDVRVRSVKVEPLRTVSRIVVDGIQISEQDAPRMFEALAQSPTGQLPARVGGTRGKYFVEVELEGELLRFPVARAEIERNLEEFPGQNIPTVCSAYYASLERLVRQCHERFDA